MKSLLTILAMGFLLAMTPTSRAQDPELVNEIVARVNNDIITRADYLNALRDFKEELSRQLQQSGKKDVDLNTEYERLKSSVLDYMIDDLLLEQKAKELNLDVEAEVNQQMAEIAKENGLPNVLAFENELKKQGVDPESARGSLRKKIQSQYVIQREVLSPIFQRLNDKDRREFYEKHKDGFTVPGEVSLSEIFLPLEGHTAAEVDQRAKRLVAELRAGKKFADAVQENSPATRASRAQGGKIGTFKQGELKEDIAAAISTLKVGEVTEPIRLQDGFQVIKLDDRKPATLRNFEDADVQNAINRAATMERADEARKKYLKKLRADAFVKISDGYVTAQAKPEKTEK
ncbi:MAG: peptidyl-prolyl cis-trans isomerase [Blastocatellia bacterium]